tara:strand:+ start:19263 stop:20303 length:1041 start_codon:yes stop_codon:yes gene_type:complete
MNKEINKSIFFIASPLQLLAAQFICKKFDSEREAIAVFYKKDFSSLATQSLWDKQITMSYPRLDPLPGIFGVHRRLLENLLLISKYIYPCNSLYFYSAVYDTETINYFISHLRKQLGHKKVSYRILPDGVISSRRYPISNFQKLLRRTRDFRYFFSNKLSYTHFSGDRIGSDADFIDHIYVLKSMPHQYNSKKVIEISLFENYSRQKNKLRRSVTPTAIVIGQPLLGFKLMSITDIEKTKNEISEYLREKKLETIYYKCHPRDSNHTLMKTDYIKLEITSTLEEHFVNTHYDYVIGVHSSALLLAKQIYSADTQVLSFGWARIKFKNNHEGVDLKNLFMKFKIIFL